MRMPIVMRSWKMTLRVPRSFGGAISDRYTGPTVVPTPTPSPRMIRPIISIAILTAAARKTAPIVKKIPAMTIVTCCMHTRGSQEAVMENNYASEKMRKGLRVV
jgi:hypothetical protein